MGQVIESDSATDVLNGIRDYARKQVEAWAEQCAQLRRWERQELLDKEPSQQTLDRHADILRFFIKTTESLLAATNDKEIYDEALRDRISLLRERLQHSQDMYHSTMSAEEANKILAQAFPNGH